MPAVGTALKAPLLTVGRQEADLFAFGPGGVHVLEPKGRSVRNGAGRLIPSTMNQAMAQVSAINTVNGIAPTSRSGCVWTLCISGIRGDIQDPPGTGWDATVAPAGILRSNYALFLEADQSRFRNDLIEGYSLIELPGLANSGLYFGIFTEILQAVSSGGLAIDTVMSLASSQLGNHLGVTASPQSPLPAGYVTLPVHSRSPPVRLMPLTAEGRQVFTSSFLFCIPVICLPDWGKAHYTLYPLPTPDWVW